DLIMMRMSDRHRLGVEIQREANQTHEVARQHQRAPDRQSEIVDPHRELQIGRAGLIDQQRGVDDLPAVPDQRAAEQDGDKAIEDLDDAQIWRRQQAQREIGPDMAVAAHELAGDDHDRPDDEIDDHFFGVADGPRGIEITSDDLKQSNDQRDQTEQADQGLLDPVPPAQHYGSLGPSSLGRSSLGHDRSLG